MKTKQMIVLGLIALSMSACGKIEATGSGDGLVRPLPPIKLANCANFSGNYTVSGIATLSIVQQDCTSIKMVQSCEGSFCSYAGLSDFSIELPLNGTEVVNAGVTYSGAVDQNELSLNQTLGSNHFITRVFSLSAHPCDPANPEAGLEVQVSDTQNTSSGSVSSSTCQPWSR